MRRPNGRGRATYSCSDQAPCTARNDRCLTCRNRFIVDHPTLPQAVAISTSSSEKIVRTAPSRLRPRYPAAGLFAIQDIGLRFHRIVNHPDAQPGHLRCPFKTIAVSCQPEEASFIRPYRNHHGHQLPLRCRRSIIWPRRFRYGSNHYR